MFLQYVTFPFIILQAIWRVSSFQYCIITQHYKETNLCTEVLLVVTQD